MCVAFSLKGAEFTRIPLSSYGLLPSLAEKGHASDPPLEPLPTAEEALMCLPGVCPPLTRVNGQDKNTRQASLWSRLVGSSLSLSATTLSKDKSSSWTKPEAQSIEAW